METAEYIFGKQRFIALEDIREFIQNNCDYKESNKEISKMFPYVDFTNSKEKESIQIEESQDNFNKRTESFYKFLLESPFKKIAVVSHGVFLKKFLDKYGDRLKIENKNWFKNCEVRVGVLN